MSLTKLFIEIIDVDDAQGWTSTPHDIIGIFRRIEIWAECCKQLRVVTAKSNRSVIVDRI